MRKNKFFFKTSHNTPLKLIKTSFLFIFFLVAFFSCQHQKKEYSEAEFALGTVCRIKIITDKSKKEVALLFKEIFIELNRLDSIFNANTTGVKTDLIDLIPKTSELEKINKKAGIAHVSVSDELFELLEFSLKFAKKTDGAFNPAIGALVKLWDIGFSGDSIPPQKCIDSSIRISDYNDIVLTKKNKKNMVFLNKKNMRLDLGGIAKGYAGDKVAKIIKGKNIENALIDIGGNIFALGKNIKNQDWSVGIKSPNIGENTVVARLNLLNKSLVTSGNYERFFKVNNKIYHHILDYKTGFPVENSLKAVSIVANSSSYADLLSTTCFVLGIEKSKAIIKELNSINGLDITAFFFYDNFVKILGNRDINFYILEKFSLTD